MKAWAKVSWRSRHLPPGCHAGMWAVGMIKDLRKAWGFTKKTPRLSIVWRAMP